MGVGPEQNFTYIAALKPAMAFIVDVRRGNLHMHLMYKALFDMSSDRAGLRVAPVLAQASRGTDRCVERARHLPGLRSARRRTSKLFEENFKAIIDNLKTKHGFALDPEDEPGIRYIYEYFGHYGPDLTYWMSGGGGGRGGFRNSPTYADLMVATDGRRARCAATSPAKRTRNV